MPSSSFSRIVINPKLWRFMGFGSSIVGFSCFALGPSFHNLFGRWNLLKIVVYCSVSFMFSVLMLFVRKIRLRFPRIFWLKALLCFAVLLLASLYSYYEDRSKQGETVVSLISFWAFALMSMSLSTQVQPGFEVGMSNFFLGCLILGVMKKNFMVGLSVAVLCFSVMSMRSFSDHQLEQRRPGGEELDRIVMVGNNLYDDEETPIGSPHSMHPSHEMVGNGLNEDQDTPIRSPHSMHSSHEMVGNGLNEDQDTPIRSPVSIRPSDESRSELQPPRRGQVKQRIQTLLIRRMLEEQLRPRNSE